MMKQRHLMISRRLTPDMIMQPPSLSTTMTDTNMQRLSQSLTMIMLDMPMRYPSLATIMPGTHMKHASVTPCPTRTSVWPLVNIECPPSIATPVGMRSGW
ncbi:MAG TPA: hypothetical protein PKO06_05060 [Candidatus Ozemobacteraceae bacterium]|nr:hypothetical protein [Candidatus Ozemobacteraceae bacterium]